MKSGNEQTREREQLGHPSKAGLRKNETHAASRLRFLGVVTCAVAWLGLASPEVGAEEGKAALPNVIYFLTDDLGYRDLGSYGQKVIKTPHLDRLASEGMRFTRHYSGSTVCAPSRCVLMTGLHTGHCRIRGNGLPGLLEEDHTLGELFQSVGYHTAVIGKWGLGESQPSDAPQKHGFDFSYGYINNYHAHNFYPEFIYRNGERVELRNVTKPVWKEKFKHGEKREGGGVALKKVDYIPELMMKEAEGYLAQRANKKEQPFFLYYALNTPHANNEAGVDPEEKDGMEVPDYGEYANEDWPKPEKGFASMMRNLDADVGRLRELLEQHGMAENTVFFFSSDNGPHQEGQHEMEFFDSNGELNGMKRSLTEGGVRVPLIAHWPGKIKAGSTSAHISAFQDMMPTFAELIGAPLLGETDGISFVPTLLGQAEQEAHEFLFWNFYERGGKWAVLKDEWKGVMRNTRHPRKKPEFVLFDLKNDPSEENNLASEHPEKFKEFEKIMKASITEDPYDVARK